MTAPINLTQLRESILQDGPPEDTPVRLYGWQVLALIDTAEAAIAYWATTYHDKPAATTEDWRTHAQKLRDKADRLDRESTARRALRESLARYTTPKPPPPTDATVRRP